MADENTGIEYGVDVNLSQAMKSLELFKKALDDIPARLVSNAKMTERAMEAAAGQYANYIEALRKNIATLQAAGGDVSRQQTQLLGVESRQKGASRAAAGERAAGTQLEQANRAEATRAINAMRSTTQASIRRLTKEVLGAELDMIRTTTEQVQARIIEEGYKARRLRSRTTPAAMRDREAIDSFKDNEYGRNVSQLAVTGRRNDNSRAVQRVYDRPQYYEANLDRALEARDRTIASMTTERINQRKVRQEAKYFRDDLFDPDVDRRLAEQTAVNRRYRAENGETAPERAARVAQEKADRDAKNARDNAAKEVKSAQEKADREAKSAQDKADRAAKKAQDKANRDATPQGQIRTFNSENYNLRVERILAERRLEDRAFKAETGETARERAERRAAEKADDAAKKAQAERDREVEKNEKRALRNQEIADNKAEKARVKAEERANDPQAQLAAYRKSQFDPDTARTLFDREQQKRQYRAQNGDAAAGLAATREKMQLNGGADFLKMQTSLLGNYALIGAATGAAGFLGNFIVQLDAEFKQFQAITATTNTEMASMKERLLDVSEATKFTALEIAEAATLMGQAGLSAGQVSEAIQPIALLATAAGTTLKDAVDVVTSTLNIFNLQTSESAHIADVYTAALNESKLTLDQLTVSLQYAGNTAATAGVGYNELTASIGAMANAGIRSGSTMGTGIRQLLVDLMNPSQKLKDELQNVGLSLSDVNVEANGLTGVIDNLQDAGFNTANAFAAFEVRAAAAFTALAANVDTINSLRQSFLLSTAAAKANDTQMGSLVNTWAKFQSNVGATASTAFEPTINFFQKVVDSVADMIGAARGAGTVLQLIAGAFTSLAVAWGTVKIGGIIYGLLGLGTAAAGATTAVGTLYALLAANPIGALIFAVTAGAMAFMTLSDSAAGAADMIDKIDARLDSAAGSISEGQGRIESLADTIEDLSKKQANLDKIGNEGLRATRVMEVVSTFSELAGEIDVSTASVSELIAALQGLKGELAGDMPGMFGMMVADLNLKIDELKRTIGEYQVSEGKGGAQDAAATMYGAGNSFTASLINRDDFDFSSLTAKFAEDFGSEVGKVYETLLNGTQLGGLEAGGLKNNLQKVILERTRGVAALEANEERTDDQDTELVNAREDLKALTQLAEAFTPLANYFVNLSATEKKAEATRLQERDASITATPGYREIEADVTGLGELSREGLKKIADARGVNGDLLSTEEVEVMLTALDEAFKAKVDQIQKKAEELALTLGSDPASGIDTSEAMGFLKAAPFQAEIQGYANPMRSEGESVTDQLREQQAYNAQKQQALLKRQIADQMGRLNKTTTEEQFNVVRDYVKRLQAELKTVNKVVFDKTKVKELEGNPAAKARAEDTMVTAQDLEFAATDRELTEARNEIIREGENRRKERMEVELRETLDAHRLALDSMDGTQSKDAMIAIRDKMNELSERAVLLAGQIAAIDVGQNFTMPTGGVGTLADGMTSGGNAPVANGKDVRDQIWNFFAGKNLKSHQIAGIMGNVAAESSFNPLAAGDRDKNGVDQAFGLFQHNDRKNNLFASIGGKGNLGNVQAQLEFAWKELQTTENKSLQKLLASGNVREATEAFLGFERPQGYNTGVRNSHSYDRRVGAAEENFKRYGGAGAGGVTPVQQQEAAVTSKANVLTAPLERNNQDAEQKIAKQARVDLSKTLMTEAKASVASINSLMTQSGTVTDPEAFKSILDQVKGRWAEVIDKQLAAYKAKNGDTANFEEDFANERKRLEGALNQDVIQLLDKYQSAIENEVPETVKVARAELAAAQDPANAGKFTETQVFGLEKNVRLAEQNALIEKNNALEQFRILIAQQLAEAEQQYGANSDQVNALRARAAEIERSVGDNRIQTQAATDAAARSEVGFKDAIENANKAWAQRQGFMGQDGEMLGLAEQVGNAWGQVLDGLSSSMSTLFMDLAQGSMTAGEAFKKFGLSVVSMLMEMIAKALAFQILQSTLGQAGGAVSGGGGFLSMLFGGGGGLGAPAIPAAPGGFLGMAGGGTIPGFRRAANGEVVPGSGFRDSVPRLLMPGEVVLRASAANQIGRDKLDAVNSLGNRTISDGATPVAPAANDNAGGVVNVWVVLPEEQIQMGPKDVVAAVSEDMRNRGMTRQLVKAISMGQI